MSDAHGERRESAEPTVEALQQDLESARAEKDEHFQGWQRAQADFANYRRRVEQERGEIVRNADARVILDLLPVLDDLERALEAVPAELRQLTWVEGILLIERKLRAVLDLHGLRPIEAEGKEFDPFVHEAVLRDGEPGEANVVTAELQKGYRLHDRVLRPTLVKVGRPRQGEQNTEDMR
ncbi:MAG: nucleotide exchange factor GrpE [Chloroflexi bacterium]|nr:nucleotide exchange factor GrpE [Chloroflexota bacterium]